MYIGARMVVIQITHTILAEHVDRYIEATLANAEETRKESGNIRFDLLRDASDPCKFQLYEVYESREAQQVHLASAHFNAWKKAVQGIFAGRSFAKFEAVHIPNS